MRILVLEANQKLFHEHTLRYFELLLPMDQIEVIHVSSIEGALPLILNESFDLVILDYNLGKPTQISIPASKEGGEAPSITVRNGAELIRLRLARAEAGAVNRADMIAFTSTTIARIKMREAAGAGGLIALEAFYKIEIQPLCQAIKRILKQKPAPQEPGAKEKENKKQKAETQEYA